jgi:hypothetical protein
MTETAHDAETHGRSSESFDETGLWNAAEKSWFVYVGVGLAIGVVFWTAVVSVMAYTIAPDWGIGGALAIGVLPGLFGGVFAGGAAGAMVHEYRHPDH